MTEASIQVINKNTVILSGMMDFNNAESIYQQGKKWIVNTTATLLIFNLDKVERCDSAGLSVLLAWSKHANDRGKAINYIKSSQQIKDIIKLVGLERTLTLDFYG